MAKRDNTSGTSGSSIQLNSKPIVYESDALRLMWDRLQHDQRLRILPFGAISKIRKFGLNNKPVKSKSTQRDYHHQHKSNCKLD